MIILVRILVVNKQNRKIVISEKHKPLILFHDYYKSKNNRWKMKQDYKNKNNNNIICMVLESPLSLNLFPRQTSRCHHSTRPWYAPYNHLLSLHNVIVEA